jgi:carbon monoxide dehydrogenase subunit G
MSVRIESTVVINAPREYVWAVIQDPERRIEWDERVVSVRQLTPRPLGKGGRLEIITSMYGLDFPAILEFVNWDYPSRSAMKSIEIGGGISSVIGSWNFDENPDGSTTWTTTIVLNEEPGLLGKLIIGLLAKTFEQLTKKSQTNLKRLIEGEYKPAPREIRFDLTAHVMA